MYLLEFYHCANHCRQVASEPFGIGLYLLASQVSSSSSWVHNVKNSFTTLLKCRLTTRAPRAARSCSGARSWAWWRSGSWGRGRPPPSATSTPCWTPTPGRRSSGSTGSSSAGATSASMSSRKQETSASLEYISCVSEVTGWSTACSAHSAAPPGPWTPTPGAWRSPARSASTGRTAPRSTLAISLAVDFLNGKRIKLLGTQIHE